MTQTRTRPVRLTGPGAQVGAEWRRLVATPGQSVTIEQPPVRHRDGTVTMHLTVTEAVAARRPAPRPAPAARALVQLRRPIVCVPVAATTGAAGYGLYRLGVAVTRACEAAWAWVTSHGAQIIGGIAFVILLGCLVAYAYKRVCEGVHYKH